MKQYIIRRLLIDDDIKEIKNMIGKSNRWIEGHYSTNNGDKSTKSNLEMDRDDPSFPVINSMVMNSLDKDIDFHLFTMAESTNQVLVSKYKEGDFYAAHEDSPNNGNFSTTLFLDDPNTYEGGELCLYLNGEVKKIKLPAGHAITYDTGILHKVNVVTKGERNVIVFWSKSRINDRFLVELYGDVINLKSLVDKLVIENKIELEIDKHDLKQSFNNPIDLTKSILYKIRRKLLY